MTRNAPRWFALSLRAITIACCGLLAATSNAVSQDVTTPAPAPTSDAKKPKCSHGRPRPQCDNFWLTEFWIATPVLDDDSDACLDERSKESGHRSGDGACRIVDRAGVQRPCRIQRDGLRGADGTRPSNTGGADAIRSADWRLSAFCRFAPRPVCRRTDWLEGRRIGRDHNSRRSGWTVHPRMPQRRLRIGVSGSSAGAMRREERPSAPCAYRRDATGRIVKVRTAQPTPLCLALQLPSNARRGN